MPGTSDKVERHLRSFFSDRVIWSKSHDRGPMREAVPDFHVLEIDPGTGGRCWCYASVGCAALREPRLELVLCAPHRTDRGVELVTMAAWYHWREGLDVGHTFPVGEPWLPGATADCFLISLPYPFGRRLEVVDSETRVLWMLPITADERELKIAQGLDALEQLFEEHQIEYWNARRGSVVRANRETLAKQSRDET